MGRPEHVDRESGIAAVPIEEVFGVEEHLPALGPEVPNGVGDHRDCLGPGYTQSMFDVIIGCFAHEAYGCCLSLEEFLYLRVILGPDIRPAGGAECNQRRGGHVEFGLGAFEELVVLRIRSWPTTLHIGDTEVV